jgi:hypothetical protein
MNLFRAFEKLLPRRPLEMGVVRGIGEDGLRVELMSGAEVRARGEASIGSRVFVRDGVCEGPAPTLPVLYVEV